MKTCSRCKESKDEVEFHKDKTTKDGLEFRCKKCKSELSKERRLANPEKSKEQNRKSLEKNYESIRASQKAYLVRNRESVLKRRRELRAPRKEEINKKEAERRKNDPNFLANNRIRFKKYYEENKEKMRPKSNANKLVMYAVKLGVLERLEFCETCGKKCKTDGHHEDYSKPLEVQWLCRVCHRHVHGKLMDFK